MKTFYLTIYNKKAKGYEKWKLVCTMGELRRKIDMLASKYIPIFAENNGQIMFLEGVK